MADFNQVLAQRYNAYASALLGIAEGPGISSMSPEVMPTLDLENDNPENFALRGSQLIVGHVSAAASVGNFSHAGLFNPSILGADLNVIIDRLTILNATGATRTFELRAPGTQAFTVVAQASTADNRVARNGRSQLVTLTTAAATGTVIQVIHMLTGTTLVLPFRFILSPQTSLVIVPDATNLAVNFDFQGYERAIRPEESRLAIRL